MLYKGKLIDGKIRFATEKEIKEHGSVEAAVKARNTKPEPEPKVSKRKAEKIIEETIQEVEAPTEE